MGDPWNLFVEGDNLDVLPTLPTCLGRPVDLVYIDPPYNTGNDFAYHDDFREDGSRRSRHQAWVAMMRPRLVAAREVLADEGAIFVSIDDNEVAHLRLLMDEVYGEENLLAQVVVNLNPKGRQLGKGSPPTTSTSWSTPATPVVRSSTRAAPTPSTSATSTSPPPTAAATACCRCATPTRSSTRSPHAPCTSRSGVTRRAVG